MSFPLITFKHTNTGVDYKLQALIAQKFSSLERYISDNTDARCDVELVKAAPHHHGPVYRVEVNLWFAGFMYRAEATEENFEKAVDSVRSELDRELSRARTRRLSLFRRGARRFKMMMQGR
jgi:ribosomal subunit interface protein